MNHKTAIIIAALAACDTNQSGNVGATKVGDVSNAVERGSPLAELQAACGSGAPAARSSVIQRNPYLQQVTTRAFTGKPSALCFGRHKVSLAERWAESNGIDLRASYFYTDSYNDLPMLQRVGTAIAVNPDTRLRRHARQRGWAVQQWS